MYFWQFCLSQDEAAQRRGGLFNVAKRPYRCSQTAPYEFGALLDHL
jgi:hypothetical protein